MGHHPGADGGSGAVGRGADHGAGDVLARAPARPTAIKLTVELERLAAIDGIRLDCDHEFVLAGLGFGGLAENDRLIGCRSIRTGKYGFHRRGRLSVKGILGASKGRMRGSWGARGRELVSPRKGVGLTREGEKECGVS